MVMAADVAKRVNAARAHKTLLDYPFSRSWKFWKKLYILVTQLIRGIVDFITLQSKVRHPR
jgi:hypothetical protein